MTTTTPEAKRMVIGALAVAGIVAAAGDLSSGEAPQLRIFIGAFLAAAVLAMVAEFSPELAAGFALLVLISAVIAGGPTTFAKVTKLTAGTGTTTPVPGAGDIHRYDTPAPAPAPTPPTRYGPN